MTTFSAHDLKVGNHLYFERGELIDSALYFELHNLDFPKVQSDRLLEINEQIHLIESITIENQAAYFDPRTPAQIALDEWQAESALTRESDRPL